MTGNVGVGRDGQRPEKAVRSSGEHPFALRYRATGGRTRVIVRGHLGEANAQRAYEYLDGVIQDDRQLLTVRMSGASSCDGYAVPAQRPGLSPASDREDRPGRSRFPDMAKWQPPGMG
jgi:hypothetical protein